jgi:hypothetical protein
MQPIALISILFSLLWPALSLGQKVAVANAKENVAYVGIPNVLDIVASNCACASLTVTTDNGKIEKTGDCEYQFMPGNTGRATIQIFELRKGRKLLLGKSSYRVKALPLPAAKVGGKRTGSIRANVLKAQLGIYAVLENFDINANYPITHFTMTIIDSSGNCQSLSSQNAFFTKEMKSLLQVVRPGNTVIFSSISAKSYLDSLLRLQPIELRIE